MNQDSYYVCYNKVHDNYFLERNIFGKVATDAHQFVDYKKAAAKIKKFSNPSEWVVQKVTIVFTVEEVTE